MLRFVILALVLLTLACQLTAYLTPVEEQREDASTAVAAAPLGTVPTVVAYALPAVTPTTSTEATSTAPLAVSTTAKPLATPTATTAPKTTVRPATATATKSPATPTATSTAQPTPAPTATKTATGGCPPLPSPNTKSSGLVKTVTMTQSTNPDTYEPSGSTTVFARTATIHAVVAIQNAPTNTAVKAAWYATDVGSAAPCNTFIDEAELTDVDGTRNLDFTLGSGNPVGTYRVQIYVNGNLDRVVSFSVQ